MSNIGITLGTLRQDATEGAIHGINDYHVQCGNAGNQWVLRLFEHAELITLARIEENSIDFCEVERQHELLNDYIYNFEETDFEIELIESCLPDVSKKILNIIDQIEFNGEIPSSLYSLLADRDRIYGELEYELYIHLNEQPAFLQLSEEQLRQRQAQEAELLQYGLQQQQQQRNLEQQHFANILRENENMLIDDELQVEPFDRLSYVRLFMDLRNH